MKSSAAILVSIAFFMKAALGWCCCGGPQVAAPNGESAPVPSCCSESTSSETGHSESEKEDPKQDSHHCPCITLSPLSQEKSDFFTTSTAENVQLIPVETFDLSSKWTAPALTSGLRAPPPRIHGDSPTTHFLSFVRLRL